jgi:hypothetical protein
VRLQETETGLLLQVCERRLHRVRGPVVQLVSVLHIGETRFYDEVAEVLAGADVVLFEGVEGSPPPIDEALGIFDFADALGLTSQDAALPEPGKHWRNADLSDLELRDALRSAGAHDQDIADLLDTPLTDDQERSTRNLAQVDPRMQAHARMALMGELAHDGRPEGGLSDLLYEEVVLGARNEVVIAAVESIRHNEPWIRTIAVLYGAAHTAGLQAGLQERGYELRGETCRPAMRVTLTEIGLGHVQLRQLRSLWRRR